EAGIRGMISLTRFCLLRPMAVALASLAFLASPSSFAEDACKTKRLDRKEDGSSGGCFANVPPMAQSGGVCWTHAYSNLVDAYRFCGQAPPDADHEFRTSPDMIFNAARGSGI